jgi:FtsP/CotA-like multicopper oxidase with cupredoxin domain
LRIGTAKSVFINVPEQASEKLYVRMTNKTTKDTTIHWHGIELESYNDGVAGWSGDTRQTR